MIIEIIIASLFGLVLGNFATSFFYRIPRGIALNGNIALNGKKPHCSSCEHPLKFYEYLPLLNWISTRGTCNYCSAKIPGIYNFIEITCMIYAGIVSYMFGIETKFIFFTLSGAILITAFAIYYEHKKLYNYLIAASLLCCIIAAYI